MSVGKKIKALRKKRGMTQVALAENIISRSMLSRIESGSAEPSVSTLRAIAQRLEVSPGFLLEENEDLLPAERAMYTKRLFDLFGRREYTECLKLFHETDFLKNGNFGEIYAYCAFSVAVEKFFCGNFTASKQLLSSVERILPSLDLPIVIGTVEHISFLRTVMDNIRSLEKVPSMLNTIPDLVFQPALFMFLLKLLDEGRTSDCSLFLEFCVLDSYYSDYIKARMLIRDYKFIDAIILLKGISGVADAPVFLRLLCLGAVENCCKLCEDYKGAYENHIEYSNILESIK